MILSGYLGSPEIAAVVADFVARAKARHPKLTYCCDPVLGDRDRGLFVKAGIPPLVRDRLCPLADIITPNHFEFEFLCGAKATTSGQMIAAGANADGARSIDRRRHQRRARGHTGRRDRDPCHRKSGEGIKAWRAGTPKLPISPSGTGDLFAALFVAARVRGSNTPDALGHAVSAIFAVLERTATSGTEEMRIVESAELLVRPARRFDPIAIRS